MKYTLSVSEDGSLTIPEQILKEMGWKEGDVLDWKVDKYGTITVTKVNDKFTTGSDS